MTILAYLVLTRDKNASIVQEILSKLRVAPRLFAESQTGATLPCSGSLFDQRRRNEALHLHDGHQFTPFPRVRLLIQPLDQPPPNWQSEGRIAQIDSLIREP